MTPKRDLELNLPNPRFFTSLFPPSKQTELTLFKNILFLGFQTLAKRKNRVGIGKAKWDSGNEFFDFF